MAKAGIVNVTGYSGVELARLLSEHPEVELVSVTGRSQAGARLSEVFPHLRRIDLEITPEVDRSVDVVFSALPHAASAEIVGPLYRDGVHCIDISADFRLKSLEEYEAWYNVKHPCPELIEEAVYGLPELHRAELAITRLVANPGCYPTGAILGLAPAIREGLIEPHVVIDSKSGISGAGRTSKMEFGFSELNDTTSAYGLGGHRHSPEMAQELTFQSPGEAVSVTFVPHLVPMTRGILGTCYGKLRKTVSRQQVTELYHDTYDAEPFVTVSDVPPTTKQTWGNNDLLIFPTVSERTGMLIVVTALDNLVKGAAGAGVQNMNVMLGLPETMGLEHAAVYP